MIFIGEVRHLRPVTAANISIKFIVKQKRKPFFKHATAFLCHAISITPWQVMFARKVFRSFARLFQVY